MCLMCKSYGNDTFAAPNDIFGLINLHSKQFFCVGAEKLNGVCTFSYLAVFHTGKSNRLNIRANASFDVRAAIIHAILSFFSKILLETWLVALDKY